ncbi:MAG: mechanosensitive ion channel family protein [Haloechinothrix sp.]
MCISRFRVIGWLVAKALRKVVNVVLDRLHFDRAVERGGIKRALERSSYDASGLVAAIVYYGVLLIALQIAFGVFGPNPVSDLLTAIVAWLPKAIVAIIIVVVAAAVAKALGDLTASALGALSWGGFVAKLVQVFVVALGVIAALNQIGVATTVTAPVLIAVLATVGGILVVGVGGGMVRPMQQRWERWLGRAEQELPGAANQVQAYQRGREDAQRARQPAAEPTEQMAQPAGRMSGSVPPAGYQGGPTPPAGYQGEPTPPAGYQGGPTPPQNPQR